MPTGDPWYGWPLEFRQQFGQSYHTAICECHDCTQARWQQSLQYQLSRAFTLTPVTVTDGVDPFNGPELNK